MAYRLVVIDLDGTLLGPDHQVGERDAVAVRACVAQGVRVVLASGRLFASISAFAKQLGLDGPHISLNGGTIGHLPSGMLSDVQALTAPLLQQAVAAFDQHRVPIAVFAANGIYIRPDVAHELTRLIVSYGEPEPIIVPELTLAHIPQPVKVLSFLTPSPLDEHLREAYTPLFEVVRTGHDFFEFLTPGVSKGAALQRLLTQFEIAPTETLVIGDNFNDVSMFRVAGTSVAMGNALPAVREQATTVTLANTESGVAVALERFILHKH